MKKLNHTYVFKEEKVLLIISCLIEVNVPHEEQTNTSENLNSARCRFISL